MTEGKKASSPVSQKPGEKADGMATRRAAFALLRAVFWQGRGLDMAQSAAFCDLHSPRDRALAYAIVVATLRHVPDFDALIDSATRTPLPANARARLVLRMALAQLLVLGTPPHAVLATCLPLLQKGPRRLTHGVLSTLLRRKVSLSKMPQLPAPHAARWTALYGASAVARMAHAFASEPPVDLSLKSIDAARWAQDLAAECPAPLTLRTKKRGDITAWPGFAAGDWWVQDMGAAIPAHLFGDVRGKKIADLCAAPGGKTMQLAALGARLVSVDRSQTRLQSLHDNLARTNLHADIVTADLLDWTPPVDIDHILLDAPCTATGIFRRHPDILYLKTLQDVDKLLAMQAALLDRAASWLPKGGRLVYCVCSLEPNEGEDQITRLLSDRPDLRIDPIRADEVPAGVIPAPQGWLRLLPTTSGDSGEGGVGGADHDGFFIARVQHV